MKTAPTKELVKEGASEIRDRVRQDLSSLSALTRARRAVSLRRTIPCMECEATGKVVCETCEGTGQQRLVWNDEVAPCPTCNGAAAMTCANCDGRRYAPNRNRKRVLLVLAAGMLAWGFVAYRFWQTRSDVFAQYTRAGGGGGGAAMSRIRGGAGGFRTNAERAADLQSRGVPGSQGTQMAPAQGGYAPGVQPQ